MSMRGRVGRHMAPHLTRMAPELTTGFVREALTRAIRGAGPLPPAASAADKQLAEQHGDVERGVHEVIENHVRLAGAGGFVTNLGGVVTAAVTIPANITGLAVIQCRMVAGIAHLRGYDLEDPSVRNAVLVCLLGEDEVARMVKRGRLPGTPYELAVAPPADEESRRAMDRAVSREVAAGLVERVVGKRMASTVARRVPMVGGLVGAGADGYQTWQVGRYTDRELRPRARR